MSRKEKLLKRFLSEPKNFTFEELETLLKGLGFEKSNKGKTSGSRVQFYHREKKCPILVHKPHPNPEMKSYAIKQIIETLKKQDLI